jgi:excisionase family DNA binding protein
MAEIANKLIGPFPVAIRLGFSPQTIVNWARRGLLPAVFVGKHVRFDPREIDEFVKSGGVQGPRELNRELNRKPATPPDPQDELRIVRYSAREHSSGPARTDRVRRPADNERAALPKCLVDGWSLGYALGVAGDNPLPK